MLLPRSASFAPDLLRMELCCYDFFVSIFVWSVLYVLFRFGCFSQFLSSFLQYEIWIINVNTGETSEHVNKRKNICTKKTTPNFLAIVSLGYDFPTIFLSARKDITSFSSVNKICMLEVCTTTCGHRWWWPQASELGKREISYGITLACSIYSDPQIVQIEMPSRWEYTIQQ